MIGAGKERKLCSCVGRCSILQKKYPHFALIFFSALVFLFNIFFIKIHQLFSGCMEVEKMCVISKDAPIPVSEQRRTHKIQLIYLYQLVCMFVYMMKRLVSTKEQVLVLCLLQTFSGLCLSLSISCYHPNGLPPVGFPGWPVQNSEAVPVHRLAGARRAQIWGGLHRLHRPGA